MNCLFLKINSKILSISSNKRYSFCFVKDYIDRGKSMNHLSLYMSSSVNNDEKLQGTIGSIGLFANLICDYSLYVLKTTGCGLPPGPFGVLGALEGISYLVVVGNIWISNWLMTWIYIKGILAWSLITKVKTGSGLPAGPNGLLGASEGVTFLTILGGLVIAGLNLSEFGFLPGFLPNDNCYGIDS